MSTTVANIDPREARGRELAKNKKIKRIGKRWVVPSQTSSDGNAGYTVDPAAETCTCPDYDLRKVKCKHQHAVEFVIIWEQQLHEDGAVSETITMRRRSYPQKWAAYNAAQSSEKAHVEMLLKALCDGIQQPARKPGPGRPSVPLRDATFAAVMKVYGTFSGRRSQTDLREAAERGCIDEAMHYNSIFNFLGRESTTPLLTALIEESATPLIEVERGQFAQDSTGFSTIQYDRWFDQKHGRLAAAHPWVKLHAMIGTATHVVTALKVSPEADCPVLPELLNKTRERFQVREVSADKAYLSKANVDAISEAGAVPYIPFKSNSTGAGPEMWRRMWATFMLKRPEFLEHYHRRSNVEAAFWMIKSKFGGAVRSKLPLAQLNEVLAKVLCHNLCCVVHATFELGISAEFYKSEPTPPSNVIMLPPR